MIITHMIHEFNISDVIIVLSNYKPYRKTSCILHKGNFCLSPKSILGTAAEAKLNIPAIKTLFRQNQYVLCNPKSRFFSD